MVRPEHLALVVTRVSAVRAACPARKAHAEPLATAGSLDSRDRSVNPEKLDNLDVKGPLVQQVILDHKVRRDRRDQLANLASLVPWVLLVPRDWQELRVRLVRLDKQEIEEVKDSQAI